MRETTAEVPYNPNGVGVRFDDGSHKIRCSEGTVQIAGETFEVAGRELTAQSYETKLARTEVHLVREGDEVRYEKAVGSPDNPTQLKGVRSLVRLLAVEIEDGEVVRGHRVDVVPMTEERAIPKRDGQGRRLYRLYELVGERTRDQLRQRFPDGLGARHIAEPVVERSETPIT